VPEIKLCGTNSQREIVFCDNRTMCLMAGRRWGKTFTFRNRVIRRCLTSRNMQYWYVAPVYAQAKDQYDAIISNVGLAKYITRSVMQPYPVVHFSNGSKLAFRSFDRPQNLRGSGLGEVWVDEIQDIDEKPFWPVIRPLLSDKRGTLVVSGQFRGHDWVYEKLYVPGQPGPQKKENYISWRYPSSTGLVFSSEAGKAELEVVRTQIPRRVYEVEYECLPIANEASVFDHADLEASKSGEVRPAHEYRSVCFGLDLGRVVDPSAMIGIDEVTKTVVFAEKRPIGEKHEVGAMIARDIARRYGDSAIIVDTTGGASGGHSTTDAYVQYYRQHCLTMRPYTITRENKAKLVGNLSLAIEQKKIQIPAQFVDLHKELSGYEYKLSSNGVITYQGPGGHDDDMVMALALAWEGILRGWTNTRTGSSEGIL